MSMPKTLQLVVALAMIAAGGWYFYVKRPQDEALRQIARNFKDPASVVFRDVRFGDTAICGYVNAKNGFGAYTGEEMFIAPRSGFGLQRLDVRPEPGDTIDSLTARQDAWLERYQTCRYQ